MYTVSACLAKEIAKLLKRLEKIDDGKPVLYYDIKCGQTGDLKDEQKGITSRCLQILPEAFLKPEMSFL